MSSESPITGSSPARLRRNGKQQSCERCRLSKLRCDHESPCGRCRRQARVCYFHPAPLTRGNVENAGLPSESDHITTLPPKDMQPPTPPHTIRRSTSLRSEPPAKRHQSDVGHGLPCDVARSTPAATSQTDIDNPSLPLPRPFASMNGGRMGCTDPQSLPSRYVPGFLGRTSHSAVLLENRKLVGMGMWEEETQTIVNEKSISEGTDFGEIILAWLPTQGICTELITRYTRYTNSITYNELIYRTYFDRFWETYGDLMKAPRVAKNLAYVSKCLSQNTAVPMPIPTSTPGFLDSFTGAKSRWDMLGCFFVAVGYMIYMLNEADPLYTDLLAGRNTTRREYAASMLECADACLLECDELDIQGSILALLLAHKCTCLQSAIGGDTSLSLWTRMGEQSAAVTAFGLHREGYSNEKECSVLYLELGRRIMSGTFSMGCLLASFHGRPPLLTRNYITIRLSLDASEEDLALDDLAMIRSKVDQNGWNLAGQIYPGTSARAVQIGTCLREEVLELSIGSHDTPEVLSMRVHDLRTRIEQAFAALPSQLKAPITKETFSTKSVWELSNIIEVQLQWKHHLFLLEKIDHPQRDEQRYLDAARKMLSDVVIIWANRDAFPGRRDDLHWFITFNGITSASALSIFLYQQKVSPHLYPPTLQSQYRAQIIKDLGVFVACLDWIGTTDGNFALCHRVTKMLNHILDRVLALPLTSPAPLHSQSMLGITGPQQADASFFADFDLSDMNVADVPAFGADIGDWFNLDEFGDGSFQPKMVFG